LLDQRARAKECRTSPRQDYYAQTRLVSDSASLEFSSNIEFVRRRLAQLPSPSKPRFCRCAC
jgi:hypothetical protein